MKNDWKVSVAMSSWNLLVLKCQKVGICIYVDEPAEQKQGIYAQLRAVASEIELTARLERYQQAKYTKIGSAVAIASLGASIASIGLSLYPFVVS